MTCPRPEPKVIPVNVVAALEVKHLLRVKKKEKKKKKRPLPTFLLGKQTSGVLGFEPGSERAPVI